MFRGPQHTLTRRDNLRLPLTMPTDGELQFTLPEVLKVPPNSRHGNLIEILGRSGGADQLHNAEHIRCAMAFRDSCTSTLPPLK
jgi:hypothetical protein